MERDNRKSHLAPQLSPATQELLRSQDSPTYPTATMVDPLQTPTSGEIPIAGGAGIIMSPRDLHASAQQQQYQYVQYNQYSGGGGHTAPVPSRASPTRSAGIGSTFASSGLGSAGINGVGRAGPGLPAHPGIGQRVVTTNSIPKITSQMAEMSMNGGGGLGGGIMMGGPASANAATFSLPMRPAPPGGPLPPPPPRKETPDELRRDGGGRRQATFGPPSNNNNNGASSYGSMGGYHG